MFSLSNYKKKKKNCLVSKTFFVFCFHCGVCNYILDLYFMEIKITHFLFIEIYFTFILQIHLIIILT